VIVNTKFENDFKMTPGELKSAITPKTKALLLCSPNNPTGSLYHAGELKAFAEIIAAHEDMYVITDEIYEHINFVGKHQSIGQFKEIFNRVVTINGVSKAYAMTGYRIGYLGAPEWIAKACIKLQGQFTTGPSSIAQQAAIAALNSDPAKFEENKKIFIRRRDLVAQLLKGIKGMKFYIPEGAFYMFPDVSYYFGKSNGSITIKDSMDLCLHLLEKAHVATVPGAAFGEPNCIRISYATSDDKLERAILAMKGVLSKLE
jgi:aspartate aminotransferase